jgi:Domain of unknown function (DUF1793)
MGQIAKAAGNTTDPASYPAKASRVPFSDLYDTISGDRNGFQARPVQGGMFALLALRNRP